MIPSQSKHETALRFYLIFFSTHRDILILWPDGDHLFRHKCFTFIREGKTIIVHCSNGVLRIRFQTITGADREGIAPFSRVNRVHRVEVLIHPTLSVSASSQFALSDWRTRYDANHGLLVVIYNYRVPFGNSLKFYCWQTTIWNYAFSVFDSTDIDVQHTIDVHREWETVYSTWAFVRNYEGNTFEQWPPGLHPHVIRHDIVAVTHNCLQSFVINCNELPCTPAIYDRVKPKFYAVPACYASRSYDLVKEESILLDETTLLDSALYFFAHPPNACACIWVLNKL